MSVLVNRPAATRLRFDDATMWVELADGRQLGVPLTYFPRLLHATPEQREQFEMSGGGTGLHWEALDEDISVDGLLRGIGDQTHRP
jgi:hypothetical protein